MITRKLIRIPEIIFAAVVVGLAVPKGVHAHLVTTGMGPVYDGIGHLLLTPEDLVPVVAVALLVGMRGTTAGRRTLFLFPFAWLAGGIIGTAASANDISFLPIVSFVVLGGLIAADIRLPETVISLLIIILGGLHGFSNGGALAGSSGVPGLLGVAMAIFVMVAIITSCVVSIRPLWLRISVRVAGSWVAAVGLLMFGWMVKGTS